MASDLEAKILKKFSEAHQVFSEQTSLSLQSKPCLFTDARPVWKAIIRDSLLCPWGKKALSKFNLLNTDKRSIWTLSMAPLVPLIKKV